MAVATSEDRQENGRAATELAIRAAHRGGVVAGGHSRTIGRCYDRPMVHGPRNGRGAAGHDSDGVTDSDGVCSQVLRTTGRQRVGLKEGQRPQSARLLDRRTRRTSRKHQ